MPQTWQRIYADRRTSLESALQAVRRGAKVFLGTACGEPQLLVQGLVDRAHKLHDVQILHFVTLGNAPYTERRFDDRFRHNAFFVGPNTRDAINEARADYTPMFIHEIPDLFRKGIVPIDVALVQTSPPDHHGFLSLGISVDIVKAAVESARVVIAQVNRFMPRTLGDSFIPVEKVHHIVEYDTPLVAFVYPELTDVGKSIARFTAKLINPGDTVHIGYGQIPYGVLGFLKDKKDLGFHTEVVSDGFIDLIEEGVATGERKTLHQGKVVCSFCIGSRKIYDYVDNNPRFAFHPAEYVYHPLVIAQNDRMAFVATLGEIGLERIIGVGRYEAEKESQGMVEVAYTVHEEYRKRRLGTTLQDRLENYAERKGFKGAVGYLFEDNLAMLKTFSRRGAYSGDILEDGILRVFRYFSVNLGQKNP